MAEQKLVGQNYTTPDLIAKVTGRAKYAEDYRADGMLFCKLLTSPFPHARVRQIDTATALALPGVKAILTADDLPDLGGGERALTNEPLYQGEPILALAAVKLGYRPVEAFDFDPACVRIARANAALNGIRRTGIRQEDVTRLSRRPARRFDLVCANLMHDLLIAECGRIGAQVAVGGRLVLAGILTTQFRRVTEAYRAAGWQVDAARTEGEWRSGSFQRR